MGDKLDSTINEVASMDRRVEIPRKAEKSEHQRHQKSESRKRKLTEPADSYLDRPNTLETAKRWKLEEISFEDTQPSTSSALNGDLRFSISQSPSTEEEVPIQTRRVKEERGISLTESDPMKIWTAADDYSLIVAVSHVSCLQFIHNSLPFTRKFTKADLEERYCQLQYDDKLSAEAQARISKMTALQRIHIESRTPFSRDEEKCLMENAEKILKGHNGDEADKNHTSLRFEHFKMILEQNRNTFHPSRNPQVISDHFRRIKSYRERINLPYTFKTFENPTNGYVMDFDLMRPLQECRSRYNAISRYPSLRGVLSQFQTNATVPDNALAMIHGRFLQFAMTGAMVVMGRSSMNDQVDIDLSKEGPAAKVSRQQALISHIHDDKFKIKNIGQRVMFVDSKPLPQMVSTSLRHGSIIEVASIRLTFSIPVPRELHPLTREIALQHKKALAEKQKKQQMAYQRPTSSSGPPAIGQKKPPRVKPSPGSQGVPPFMLGQKIIRKPDPAYP
uniref:FHA domain-containing protein n=1 Tax=Caenorhabditis tropicalis TaxID=1561998 RepID=A0A1I7TBK4_9PELO